MPNLTKIPEGCPVSISADQIAAFHPWEMGGDRCVKVILNSGVEIHVSESFEDVDGRLPPRP